MTLTELKQIRLYRQHVTNKTDKMTVVHDLNGVQAQFMVNAFHSLKIRCADEITEDNFGENLVKNWTIRGTVHVFAEDDLKLFKHGIERYLNKDFGGYFNRFGGEWALTPQRQQYWSDFIIKQVANGIGKREELKDICLRNGMQQSELAAMFEQWGGGMRDLCERGFLNYKVQEKKVFDICVPFTPMDTDSAELEMARRYFEHFAPSTIKDAAYYFGWTQAKTKAVMKNLPLEAVSIDGKEYFYIGNLCDDYLDVPKCIFLAGFDQLMLGYKKEESIFLPSEHLRKIFNLAGIVTPAILVDGRVVGRWRKKNNKMTFEMFEIISDKEKLAILNVMQELFDGIKKVDWAII